MQDAKLGSLAFLIHRSPRRIFLSFRLFRPMFFVAICLAV